MTDGLYRLTVYIDRRFVLKDGVYIDRWGIVLTDRVCIDRQSLYWETVFIDGWFVLTDGVCIDRWGLY